MESLYCYTIAATQGYILGSCPNGFIVALACGLDIRKCGSGNIGATNVLRVLGKKKGYLVFFLDVLKGFVAVRIGFELASLAPRALPDLVSTVAGLACILGHTFPVWLNFRGGKGVATSAGVLLGLMPIAVVSVFLVWLSLFKITRYVSVASIVAAAMLPIFVMMYLRFDLLTGRALLPFSILITGVVIWRHRTNMRRLLQGTESRFGKTP